MRVMVDHYKSGGGVLGGCGCSGGNEVSDGGYSEGNSGGGGTGGGGGSGLSGRGTEYCKVREGVSTCTTSS